MSVKMEVWGEWALFTRPEMKVERVSYDIPTPSAARGMLEAVYYHPGLVWRIDRIHVMNPIRFTNLRRNEVDAKILASDLRMAAQGGRKRLYLAASDHIQQRAAMMLKDVRYVIEAHFDMTERANPIIPQEVTITRVAITTEADAEKKGTEMGRKYIVPYGLYRVEGFVSANLARRVTGFSQEDLELLWQAILNMFEHDHSAARGKMAVRELIVFEHESELGNAPAYKLFEAVKVSRVDPAAPPRSYADYVVDVDTSAIPEGVVCRRLS